MDNSIINVDLLKKILSFLKKNNSLRYLDPNIFERIDRNKEFNDIPFTDYYLEYIKNLPRLDFETTVKISREVYQQYGKENAVEHFSPFDDYDGEDSWSQDDHMR